MACALHLLSPSVLYKPLCSILVVRGTRGIARAATTRRYKLFKENEGQRWDEFFASPYLYLDHRQSKAEQKFADFSLKGNSNVALYIGDNARIEKRLWEVDSQSIAALKAEVVPHPDEWMRQHFEVGRPLTDVRAHKRGKPRRPDFIDDTTGHAIWLTQCSPWVHEQLQARDAGAPPPKPVIKVEGAAPPSGGPPGEAQAPVWTEEQGRAITDALLGSLAEHAAGEAEPPEGAMHSALLLEPYQKSALAWMLQREQSQPSGGILADDQGLGKTITALSLVACRSRRGAGSTSVQEVGCADAEALDAMPAGGTLIISPKSVLDATWAAEIDAKMAPHWRVFQHTQGLKGRDSAGAEYLASFDIVLTTHNLMLWDSPVRRERHSALFQVHWHRVIIDEAHFIKNHTSKTAAAATLLEADHRWLLSGTPIQNRPEELFSYLAFLKYFPYNSPAAFHALLREPKVLAAGASGVERLRAVLKLIILRRTKQTVINGRPILDLPPWQETKDAVTFSREEAQHYEMLAAAEGGVDGEERQHLFAKLTQLRMACAHPQLQEAAELVREAQKAESACREHLPDAEPVPSSGKLDRVLQLAAAAQAGGEQMLVFSQWTATLDLLEPALGSSGIKYCRLDGQMTREVQAQNLGSFRSDISNTVFLISLKAGGTGLNLPCASLVVLVDPYWNVAVEEQAISRAHRRGQTKLVHVYKLFVPGTVEEKILELQSWKRIFINDIIDEKGRLPQQISLRTDDLKFLLGQGVSPSVQ